jgi:hypothetical protein
MDKVEQQSLTDRMNTLAEEMAKLKPNDHRRAEIVSEITRLSLLSASLKQPIKDG